MPRKSDTHSRVIEVADQLLEEGVRPTQQNVRERLGSGSLTTINRALNDWWHTLAQRISRRNEHPELPEPVLTLANQTWDRALAYAEHQFSDQRQALELKQQELLQAIEQKSSGGERALAEAQQQNARLLDRCEALAQEKRELEKRVFELEEMQLKLTVERDNAQREVRQLQHMGAGGMEQTEAMIELRVRARMQEEELQRLRQLSDRLSQENAQLRNRSTDH
jgi:chromosome segregation ATPase